MSLAQLHGTLLAEWKKTQRNLQTIDQVLKQLQTHLLDANALAGLDKKAQETIFMDTYEISSLLAVLNSDMPAFEDSILQVLSLYEISSTVSANKYLMMGLYLMFLLASGNRLSDFHMILEQIPLQDQNSNTFISTPVRLEQSLMEGAYNKVVLTEKNIPSEYYATFIRIMMDAIRRNIASSVERSFKLLSVKDAVNMLLFTNEAQVTQFAKERKWKQENEVFVFEGEAVHNEKQVVDTARIAQQVIFYAKQLEMIV